LPFGRSRIFFVSAGLFGVLRKFCTKRGARDIIFSIMADGKNIVPMNKQWYNYSYNRVAGDRFISAFEQLTAHLVSAKSAAFLAVIPIGAASGGA
jgi:hypothetical protein